MDVHLFGYGRTRAKVMDVQDEYSIASIKCIQLFDMSYIWLKVIISFTKLLLFNGNNTDKTLHILIYTSVKI
jgi:hypothetical protein